MPLADVRDIPSFAPTAFEQGSPDDDARLVGSACKPVKSNDDGTCEPDQSLSDTIKETSTSNESNVHEGMAFTKHKSLRDGNCFWCSCWHSEKDALVA
jgi:hypothetical protein